MSFSGDVKREVAGQIGQARHCVIAELSALLSTCGKWQLDPPELKIRAESEIPYKKIFTLLGKAFNIKIQVEESTGEGAGFSAVIRHPAHVLTILSAAGLIERREDGWHSLDTVDPRIIHRSCCKRAYIRGAFLGCGSVNDPNKTYHLEFVLDQETKAETLQSLFMDFDVETHRIARSRNRRTIQVVYLKDGSQIADVLNIIGGHLSLLKFEDIRVVKDVRNQVNRQVNCEAANLDRVVSAAVRQIEDIRFLQENVGLEQLPEGLREAARLRLEHEDLSLQELAAMMGIGKSGVNHRFRKLMAMADARRKEIEKE